MPEQCLTRLKSNTHRGPIVSCQIRSTPSSVYATHAGVTQVTASRPVAVLSYHRDVLPSCDAVLRALHVDRTEGEPHG